MVITVIGTGFVGVVSSAVFASFGNTVYGLDVIEEKIEKLKKAQIPFYEPGLEELVKTGVEKGDLHFTTSYQEAISQADVIMIAVGTPSASDGQADLKYVFAAAESLAPYLKDGAIVAIKSTVPPGTNAKVAERIKAKTQVRFSMASLPEFLKEGSAVQDTLHPDRIIVGATETKVIETLSELHKPLQAEIVVMKPESAQMCKYSANAYLATRITFINQIANLCEVNGANILEVIEGIGFDKRIGKHYWYPGFGYGGSCFEGDETIFTLNSPNVRTQRLDNIFQQKGERSSLGEVEVLKPKNQKVLAFNLDTGSPSLADVYAVTRRRYIGDMVTISTSMGRTMRVTSDHPVILRESDSFKVVPAFAVSTRDQVMALMDLPIVQKPNDLNLIDLLQNTSLMSAVYVSSTDLSFTKYYPLYARHIPKSMLRYPYEIKQNNRMSLSLYYYLSQRRALHLPINTLQLYTAKGAATKINAHIPIDKDFMRLCGYYLAEGCITRDIGRVGAQRDRVEFSFSELEHEYIADVQRILQNLGMKHIERHSTHAISTIVSSRVFSWLFRDILKMGTCSVDKTLPSIAFNVSSELRFELLRGMFSGDGAVTRLQHGKNMMFEYATVSKSLADGTALLLQSLGFVPSIRSRMMNKSKHLAYILRINGYNQMEQLTDLFGNKRHNNIKKILAGYQRKIAQRGFKRNGSYALLKILKVKCEKVDTFVYSLETSTHTVVGASGLIQHNCFPKDVKELAAYAKAIKQDGNLMVKINELNEDRISHLMKRYEDAVGGWKGKKVTILGLSFKPNTDDMREAPSTKIIPLLIDAGAIVTAYDPMAIPVAKEWFPQWNITYAKTVETAIAGADVVMILVEWPELISLEVSRIREAMGGRGVFIDVRNQYVAQRDELKKAGITYIGVGVV
ncbi:MAG: nucleotide sugar dehydrogenase [Candidatus Pacebacteria bacterium]|nr:nucleotide sugar dehydrogenase [Candidatus Paceibacterota bacterium]